jgi:mannose-6-phosphate isomerase class I
LNNLTYDRFPSVTVPGTSGIAFRGWGRIAVRLKDAIDQALTQTTTPVVAIECYTGVFEDEILAGLRDALGAVSWVEARIAMHSQEMIERMIGPDLGGNDPVFGFMTRRSLADFFCPDMIALVRAGIARRNGPVVIIGQGATVIWPEATVLVYADLPRWVAQGRQRRNEVSNLGVANRDLKASLKYKRAYFVDWRVCDRVKRETMGRWDFVLETCEPGDPKMVEGPQFRAALAHCVTRPIRLVPFFDAGPWGGQWMKEKFGLDRTVPNFAWGFDCVPEENSLRLKFGDVTLEVPAIDLVLAQPRALLGEPVHGRFGAEFPIRFDLLDTMGGGNLSLQVHPLTDYINEHFGMRYTQDESYYLLDSEPGSVVYLGRKSGANRDEMFADLESAQRGEKPFDAERFASRFPAKKHDHFLIPAGTMHCSGAGSVVLEISATPYIFTFKLWDWGRMGLDGAPRPLHIQHGKANIQWDRDERYAAARLVNQVREVGRGSGWREERTGLHEAEFIETRRHWFTGPTSHDTGGERQGSVNVLNLVEGEAAVVESPDNAFAPFEIHYAETFIVPASVGRYCVRPIGRSEGRESATIKAFVRSHP